MLEEPWHIQMLGQLRAAQGAAVVARFRTQQTGALLARLALFPRRLHTREELADLLWPDDDPGAARAKLRIALSSLRRQLEPTGAGPGSVLQADRLSVRLTPGSFTTDVARFEDALARVSLTSDAKDGAARLRRAVALYTGELLPGFYDDWVVDERERLQALFTRANKDAKAVPVSGTSEGITPQSGDDFSSTAHVHLPPQWTRFFGRGDELERLRAWLAPPDGERRARLVTLTGPGGVGKTRLSLEAARALAPAFPQGVYFIALAELRDGSQFLPLIMERLGLPHAPADDPRQAIAEHLSAGPSLLLLDNLEQVADEVAPRVQDLLGQVPSLCCLATSRRVLRLPGERVLTLGPLPTPGDGDTVSAVFPGVALFVDRARQHRPDFGLAAGNAGAVGRLCARLDGLPLALELAGAWIGVLTPAQMLTRLEKQTPWLVSRRKDAPERHQTLTAMLDWSFDLLPPPLQRAWSCASVFRDGWTAEAMTAVCPDAETLETLTRLRERSLVIAEETPDGAAIRFRMLETLRDYARARLDAADREDAHRRHARFHTHLAEEAAPHLRGPDQARWLDRLERERANLRAALDWCAADASGEEGDALGLSLAAALARFWMRRGPLIEGRERLTAALARPGARAGTQTRANALNGCGLICWMEADYEQARACHEEALALRRALGDPRAIGASLGNLGLVAVELCDYEMARHLGEEALALNRQAGDLRGQAIDLNNLGDVATHQGRHDDARTLYGESLTLRRQAGDHAGEAITLGNLGLNAAVSGDYARAAACHQQALRLRWETNDRWRMTFSLSHLADARRQQGDWDTAARLYGTAQALRDQIHLVNSPVRRQQLAEELSALRQAFGSDAFETAYAQGYALTLEAAVRFALEGEETLTG